MNIVFLCNEYPPGPIGGIGAMTHALAVGLARRGHSVRVAGVYAGLDSDRVEVLEGVAVHRWAIERRRLVSAVEAGACVRFGVRTLAAESPIDVIDTPELGLLAVSRRASRARVIRMNGGHHFFAVTLGKRPRRVRGALERVSFWKATHFCAVSHFAAERTRELLGLGDVSIPIIPNPVDTELFRPRPEIPVVPGRIFFAGTLCEKKGIRQLVAAMPMVVARVPHAHLVAAGKDTLTGPDGTSFSSHLLSIVPAELRPKVTFLGAVAHERLPELMATSQVCAYPSHMETQGIVNVEGMAMGKPVIVGDAGPAREIVEPGVHGFVCDPRSPDDIAAKIISLLNSPELCVSMGAAARDRAVREFGLAGLLEKNEEFYRSILG